MRTIKIRAPYMGLTFKKVWAMSQETDRKLQESALQIKEMSKETDRRLEEAALQIKEMSEKTDRILQEAALQTKENSKEWDARRKEIDYIQKENSRMIGNLGGRMGDLVEHLVIPNILEKFNKRGYAFGRAGRHVRYHGPDGNYLAEVDILLENGDTVLAVEVKTVLTAQDVKDHVKRMQKLRLYADERKDQRKLLGAVTGAIASPQVKDFALKNGFFVLEQTGDTMRINVPDDFSPRVW
ncbi:MAG: hypothetical protein LBT00_06675 [Spirochaetaceae bacterium]|nr:hypothetical protein [Spirochaetaceae bacterium]